MIKYYWLTKFVLLVFLVILLRNSQLFLPIIFLVSILLTIFEFLYLSRKIKIGKFISYKENGKHRFRIVPIIGFGLLFFISGYFKNDYIFSYQGIDFRVFFFVYLIFLWIIDYKKHSVIITPHTIIFYDKNSMIWRESVLSKIQSAFIQNNFLILQTRKYQSYIDLSTIDSDSRKKLIDCLDTRIKDK